MVWFEMIRKHSDFLYNLEVDLAYYCSKTKSSKNQGKIARQFK